VIVPALSFIWNKKSHGLNPDTDQPIAAQTRYLSLLDSFDAFHF
jgi:hypothetical protein